MPNESRLLRVICVLIVLSELEAKEKVFNNKDAIESWLLKREVANDLKVLDELDKSEGSGNGDGDEEYYDEDDEYMIEKGSGDFNIVSSLDNTLIDDNNFDKAEKENNVTDGNNDIHFLDNVEADDNLLLEYYEEDYVPSYYLEPEVYLYKEEAKDSQQSNITPIYVSTKSKEHFGFLDWLPQLAKPSYIYVTLSSAIISFSLALIAFFLCRRHSLANRKNKLFVLSNQLQLPTTTTQSTSGGIVKNYQLVPTATRDFLSNKTRLELPTLEQTEKNHLLP